jgi:hypothetical protein
MRANLGEPVEVWLRDGTPARFIWRGRRYTVMFVLDRRFVPAAPLINSDAPPAEPTRSPDAPPAEPIRSPDAPPAEPTGGTGGAGTGAGNDCWRVEATPERTLPPARYELCHDLAADRWSLSRD